MDPAITTLCVLAVAAFLFVTELIPLAVTAMAACTALGILGVLPSKQVYAGLSNSTVVLFGGMFVIGAAMFKTGLAEAVGLWVVNKAGTGEVKLMGAVMLVTIILSSVSSNTGTVACLMPVIIGIAQAANIPASKELMPLAVAANVGGTITMIGTPPNVIVTGALSAAGLPSFGFFEFALIGVPLSIIVLVYMLTIGRKTIPIKNAGAMDADAVEAAKKEAGAGKLIADTVVGMMGEHPNPIVLCAVLYLISNVLTQFMSNTASAALLAPIGISIAQSIGADPKPVLMAIGIAASMAYATPMATPPNTLVLGPGGFSFNDYVKVGVPLCIITFIVSVIIIPIFWPFFPG